MVAVFIASPHPEFNAIGVYICLFAIIAWGSFAALKFSVRTIRKVAAAFLLALVLAVGVVQIQDVYWAPYCEGIFYYVNWLMCSEFISWGG